MRFKRRRSDRPDAARAGLGSGLEVLEGRTLLSGNPTGLYSGPNNGLYSLYFPSDIAVSNPITGKPYSVSALAQLSHNPSTQNSLLGNAGKVVSGEDRAGDQYTIVVHGPGEAIVTDISPQDGSLDDNINTIQLVGTSINSTYVTGTVIASNRTESSGTVPFEQLVDTSGVRSVILNGFTLQQTFAPTNGGVNNSQTGVFLTGGVRYLSFADVNAPVDTGTLDDGVTIEVGDPNTPTTVQPTIVLNHIFATVSDSTATTVPANNVPVTTPTVSIVVNGALKALDLISAGSVAEPAGTEYLFPLVTTTGRTSVQAQSVGSITVTGSATNFTASRAAQPFQNGFSGLSKLGAATFGGPTDAVGLDVNGPIKKLTFKKGLGNPAGVAVAQTSDGISLPTTGVGAPAAEAGYAAVGLVSGQVTATSIGSITAGPANLVLQTPSNPALVQLREGREPFYVARPGSALTNSLISASGNIGTTKITGDLLNSEIKSGFHYPSFAAGLEGTRAKSKLGKVTQNGSQINSVVSATYRAGPDKTYGTIDDTPGPGTISGGSNGVPITTGAVTPLGNAGAGFFAKKKV